MFCINCGTKLEESANFCQRCGNSISSISEKPQPEKHQSEQNYAIVHFYRTKFIVGGLVSPKLFMDGNRISNIKRNWKKTINVSEGLHIFTTRTEVTTEIKLQVERGKEYFIRCDIGVGFFVGHFKFTLVDAQMAQQEMLGLQAEI